MVNANAVNAKTLYFTPPRFYEFFRVSGRIPRFQNPVKYTRIFYFNHKTVHSAAAPAEIPVQYQCAILCKGALPTIAP